MGCISGSLLVIFQLSEREEVDPLGGELYIIDWTSRLLDRLKVNL